MANQRPTKELWQYSNINRRERDEQEIVETTGMANYFSGVWEKLEFYVFLLVGSYSWYYIVFKVLDWHRFPIHLYTVELWLVVVVPIILILVMLYVMDWLLTPVAPVKED